MSRRRRRRGSRILFPAYRLLYGALARLPVGAAFLIGEALGLAAWLVLPGYRKLAERNVRIAGAGMATAPGDAKTIVRRHFRSLGGNLLSIPALARLPEEALRERVDLSQMQKVIAISSRKQGVVALLSHIGNWELLAQCAALEPELRAAAIYQAQSDPHIDAHIRQTRAARGLRLYSRADGFEAPIRHVREGGLLGILADQHAGDKGLWTPFCRRIASTSPLAAMISLRTGAPVVPTVMQTAGRARWRLVVDAPIEPQGHSLATLTVAMNCAIERQVERHPEDWFWVHNRWKTPRPQFLLRHYRRGVHLPDGMPADDLQKFRILIRSSNWLGDAAMSVPGVQAIKQGRPDAHLTILCRDKLADFWRIVAGVDEIVPIAPGEGIVSTARKLRRLPGFDVGIILPNSLRTGLEMLLAGIPRRAGYAGHHRAWTLNQIIPEQAGALRAEHHVHRYLRLARHLGAETSNALSSPSLTTRPLPDSDRLRIGLCPGAEYGGAKRWPVERFAAVATEVSKRRNSQWVVFGTAKEAALAETLCAAIDGETENLAGKTTLAGLIDELRRCHALLTNDTGTMHLAALLGVRVVALFGSTEPRLTAPLGHGHIVLRHQVECSPCFLRECPLDFRCMQSIEVDEAVEALLQAVSHPETP